MGSYINSAIDWAACCPGCGTPPGTNHGPMCSHHGSGSFWPGPTATGMKARVMVPHDVVAWGRTCPACEQGYEIDPYVFEPADQSFSIHVACVVRLANIFDGGSQADDQAEIDRRYAEACQELDGEDAA